MSRPSLLFAGLLLGGSVAAAWAQIEGGNRGVVPFDTSSNLEVGGVSVDVRAGTAEAARLGGWRLAQRRAWTQLWAKTHGGEAAPALGDDALDGLVAGIVVEDEQIGPQRYIARLGVLFDRSRAGALLGTSDGGPRSAPVLVIPVQWSAGGPDSFESRSPWQRAWANFRTGASPVDYVRPVGTGADPLLLGWGQAQRNGRAWWRTILDQYGAADVVVPQVRLQRSWPGGPVTAVFSARHGPDGTLLGAFTLTAAGPAQLPAMLDEGVRRIDAIYAQAFAGGTLRPDPSLTPPPPPPVPLADESGDEAQAAAADTTPSEPAETPGAGATAASGSATEGRFTVQYDSPDVASIGAAEAAVRAVPGVRSASTTSLALGGTSVMSVSFAGDAATLRLALQARGYRVSEAGGTLRVKR